MSQSSHSDTELPVTFIICAYNQERFIRESIEGALAQTYSPIEIIISDDCSTDDTYSIIESTIQNYTGDHKILVNRNPRNLGLIKHVNKVFELASGELIVGSAGDDVSDPERVQKLVTRYRQCKKKAVLFHGDVIAIDEYGKELGVRRVKWGRTKPDLLETALSDSLYIGASSAFSRTLLDTFDPVVYEGVYEDLVWGFRAALIDAVSFIDEPMVKYRIGVGVSSAAANSKPKTYEDLVVLEQERLRSYRDVLSQRLLDLDQWTTHPEYRAVRRNIKKERLETDITLDLLSGRRALLKYILTSPRVYRRVSRSYRKRVRRLQNRAKEIRGATGTGVEAC